MGGELSKLTTEKIASYVSSLGPPYEKYKEKIIDNNIDGCTLLNLSDDNIIEAFKELDINSVIHTAKLRSELKKFKDKINDNINNDNNINDNVFNEYLKTYRNNNDNNSNIKLQESNDNDNNNEIIDENPNIIKLRDFTITQLNEYNGKDDKPIYISLRNDVFDVTIAKEFYGEGSGYSCFAGCDASRALGKMSFNNEDIINTDITDLTSSQRAQLDEWYFKFKYIKKYPIIGRLSYPTKYLKITVNELHKYKDIQDIPEGRIYAPLLIAINNKIVDVSYGGTDFYGIGGPYNCFVGNDASRALAKMTFNEEDLSNSDTSDLSPAQLKTLQDWYNKLISKYPVVGEIIK